MTKEELIEFLKENLRIEISLRNNWDYYSESKILEVSLFLGNDEFSTCTEYIN
jgi:hypothetical protein